MVLDHIHQMFAPVGAPVWLNWLGRPVMIMFLFIMAESFQHTSNRKKLLLRLLFGAWFMTVFSIIMENYLLPNEQLSLYNNAFTTLFMAGLYMLFWDMFTTGIKTRNIEKVLLSVILSILPALTIMPYYWAASLETSSLFVKQFLIVVCSMIPNIFLIEGGPLFALLGVLFYVFRNQRLLQLTTLVSFSILIFFTNNYSSYQWLMVFGAIPMVLYNGEKGKGLKSFFYIFYPAHIYLLYIIASLWNKS
jgi:hypothetical protein